MFLTGGAALLLGSQTAFGASSASSSSAPSTLYDRIKVATEEELVNDTVEPEIIAFVRKAMGALGETVSEDDVTSAVKHEDTKLCGSRPSGDSAKSNMGCGQIALRIRKMVENERRVRTLSRSLQLAATSYELPISHLPGRGVRLAQDIRGVVSIWAPETADTGTDVHSATGSTAGRARTKAIDETVMRPLLMTLGRALENLSDEERTAAVWRYQYGARLVRGDRAPDFPAPYQDNKSGPGTERQYLFKNWPGVENALTALWNAVKDDEIIPELTPGETVLYIFPEELLKETLPDNILVWIRTDGPDEPHKFGDSGLQWVTPLEPVLPSLIGDDDDQMIEGGEYPPEPVVPYDDDVEPMDGRGLCSDPQAARGYLCRPFKPAAGEKCPNDPANPIDEDKISLVTCLDETKDRHSMSGPDVCRDIDIREDHTFDPQRECTISFRCGNNCGAEFGGGVDAVAKSKDNNGVIEVCVDSGNSGPGLTELVFHELVHAYQFCTMPPGFNYNQGKTDEQKAAICCEMEGGGYRAQCDMAAENGAFDGNPMYTDPTTGEQIPINAESCAEALTNLACGPTGYQNTITKCYESRTYPRPFASDVFAKITGNPKVDNDPPITCSSLSSRETMDPRIRDLVDAIEGRRDVCGPGQTEVFRNTIGNNMCYIGQCVEESLELYRTTGAQMPATVGDEGYPWSDPKTGAPLGNAVLNPPLTPSLLALYRPQLVVQEMETALCQLSGLPPLTPSILCTYNPGRNLEVPMAGFIDEAQSLLQGKQSEKDATSHTLALALGLGSRLGTTLYAQELQLASRSLSDVLNTAVFLFKEMAGLEFPTEMCPTDNTIVTAPLPTP